MEQQDVDKLILTVLQGDDYDEVVDTLNQNGFFVTTLYSTGGFLKKRSVTACSAPQPIPDPFHQTRFRRLRSGFRQSRPDQDRIHAKGLDLVPWDAEGLFPPHQPEQFRTAEQKQCSDLCRLGVEFQIIGSAQTGTFPQLHHFFCTQFPKRHKLRPLPSDCMARTRTSCAFGKIGWKSHPQLCYTECSIAGASPPGSVANRIKLKPRN